MPLLSVNFLKKAENIEVLFSQLLLNGIWVFGRTWHHLLNHFYSWDEGTMKNSILGYSQLTEVS